MFNENVIRNLVLIRKNASAHSAAPYALFLTHSGCRSDCSSSRCSCGVATRLPQFGGRATKIVEHRVFGIADAFQTLQIKYLDTYLYLRGRLCRKIDQCDVKPWGRLCYVEVFIQGASFICGQWKC